MENRLTRRSMIGLVTGLPFSLSCDAPTQPAAQVAPANVLVGLDPTGSLAPEGYSGRTEFDRGVAALEELVDKFPAASQLTIAAITQQSLSRPWQLLSARSPKSVRRYRDALKPWKNRVKATVKQLGLLKGETDLFGFLIYAQDFFRVSHHRKVLVLISDLRASVTLNLEDQAEVERELASDLRRTKDLQLLADLTGIRIHCLWLHGGDRTPRYWALLRDYWHRYFQESRGDLRQLSMEWNLEEIFK